MIVKLKVIYFRQIFSENRQCLRSIAFSKKFSKVSKEFVFIGTHLLVSMNLYIKYEVYFQQIFLNKYVNKLIFFL